MAKQSNHITDELLAAFMDGNTTREETQMVLETARHDSELRELILLSQQVDEDMDEEALVLDRSQSRELPMLKLAAKNTIDNLCAIRCEGFVLRALGLDVSDAVLIETSERQGWLQPEGTALHRIGQLAGSHGLYVSHRYDCSESDIEESLKRGDMVIAVIDSTELSLSREQAEVADKIHGEQPNHAVVITGIDIPKAEITIFDPASPDKAAKKHPLPIFIGAWNDSQNYLVIISNQSNYEPHPLNLADIPLESELAELREAIAENAHEVWAKARKDEGWTYGPVRDDERKLHPDMLPYNLLPEREKEYDRLMAVNTIKLVKKLGWEFVKRVK